ncbi:MAG: DUF4249 domain-containing protein [Chitinophagales bacterium]|nr:DUF4249 domain-containing protein [Chitinophagales bacterium]
MLVLFCFSSCNKTVDLNIANDYKVQLVIFCSISPQNGVSATITKSLNPTDTVYFSDSELIIRNAVVELYENNLLVDTLQDQGNGTYTAKPEFIPEVNNSYYIIVKATGFTDALSSEVVIPKSPQISNTGFSKDGIIAYNDYEGVAFNFDLTDPIENNYYRMTVTNVKQSGKWENDFLDIRNFSDAESEVCLKYGPGLNNLLVLDDCFDNSVVGFQLVTTRNYTDSIGEFPYLKYFFTIAAIDENYFKYSSSSYQPAGIENYFIEPAIQYSNFTNAIGIFYAYNESVFEYIP